MHISARPRALTSRVQYSRKGTMDHGAPPCGGGGGEQQSQQPHRGDQRDRRVKLWSPREAGIGCEKPSFLGAAAGAKNLSLAVGRPTNLAKNLSLGPGPVRS